MGPVVEISERHRQAIQDLCLQIADGLQAAGGCPCCSGPLQPKVTLEAVEVSCPAGCFRFTFRRDPLNGAFVSGSLDFANQDALITTGQVQSQ